MISLKKLIIKIFFIISFFPILLPAQESISVADSNQVDTTFVMQKSAWGAVIRSAIFPGWGQVYNESYWKVPIVWGIGGWFIYNYIKNNKDYKNSQNLYLKTIDSQYLSDREFYRDQRDLFAMYLVFTYLANLVDAYVDAHLFDFSVTEDFYRQQPMFNFKIVF
ncbi:MAG: hypothetical protein COZ80_03120 [Ignavibacteria bacterium CG_4_8_14_3_um_filter_37_9]|nr:MAG: hypothetical protein AUJ54_01260 [Ignavibacteria bacterium CG1_02_37_35]PIS46082.1 MAG: hypothetical protein COT22_01745 [Ignavibacteria bacterium CG08_land_8_20_14_0_20_37_9]PIW99881.1 MAG: hypothetical protein COZ80_03120 [Ignavibacteria bacterium CG_4_8_14_3_um_filter_37_9]PIX92829.1 MAG: hypothetical protein COZ25_13705 [Ignavibacteria bacterium CG_4_10_14_3_um_filter_37_18]PJC61189.1 MAG: hypothetical protein CO025_00235 [Ignavibacteria bacterium CG_4_9_14_0_2_um_filter_37_13]